MRPDLITFDCYGTLIDWERGIEDAFRAVADRHGWDYDANRAMISYHEIEAEVEAGEYRRYRDVLSQVARGVADRMGWPLPPDRDDVLARALPSWPAFDDANPALERLNAAGYRLGILSNIDDDLLADTLRHFSVAFDFIVTAEQAESYKPAPDHFRRALDEVGGESDRLLHMARSYYHDVRPARRLGIATVWVNRGAETRPGGPEPTAEVRDLTAAVDWLESRTE